MHASMLVVSFGKIFSQCVRLVAMKEAALVILSPVVEVRGTCHSPESKDKRQHQH